MSNVITLHPQSVGKIPPASSIYDHVSDEFREDLRELTGSRLDRVLGAGARVVTYDMGNGFVLKRGIARLNRQNHVMDPHFIYLRKVMEAGENPYLPKTTCMYQKTFILPKILPVARLLLWGAVQEKLTHVGDSSVDKHVKKLGFKTRYGLWTIENAIYRHDLKLIEDKDPLLQEAVMVASEALKQSVKRIGFVGADLHRHNIMLRRRRGPWQVVITDPIN